MIYAVNKRTKEHVDVTDMHMPEVAEFINGDKWKLTHADADGWIEWDGDDNEECPLPEDCPVEVKRRGPDLKVMQRERAASLAWQDIGSDFTITAYRPILGEPAKPEPPAWDGEGLPPVGCECEYYDAIQEEWIPASIVAHHINGEEAIWSESLAGGNLFYGTPHDFRPIRSAEDRSIDEMIAAAGLDDEGYNRAVCRDLLRAGYRKTATTDGEDT